MHDIFIARWVQSSLRSSAFSRRISCFYSRTAAVSTGKVRFVFIVRRRKESYTVNDEWNAIDLSPSASITLSSRSCTRLDVVGLLFHKMKSKRARSIYGTLSVCGFVVNKSYAPGACTSVDAIRLLFDSYSKIYIGYMKGLIWEDKIGAHLY